MIVLVHCVFETLIKQLWIWIMLTEQSSDTLSVFGPRSLIAQWLLMMSHLKVLRASCLNTPHSTIMIKMMCHNKFPKTGTDWLLILLYSLKMLNNSFN